MDVKHNCKCAIFDLDGTLIDSMGVWESIDIEFLSKRGISPVPSDYMQTVAPMGFWRTAEYTIERFGLDEKPQSLIDEWTEMAHERYSNSVPLKPHAKEFLEYLKAQGILLGLATATMEHLAVPALKNTGIYGLFDCISSTDAVKRGKGFPDIYLYVADKLGVKPADCAVFEDIPDGILGARAAGMYAVGVFDSYSAEKQTQLKQLSDKYILDFAELIK